MLTRRRFLSGALPLAALFTGGVAYAGYRRGTCPLSSEAYCVGPCSAFVDSGNGLCQRVSAAPSAAEDDTAPAATVETTSAASTTPTAQPTTVTSNRSTTTTQRTACPYGLVNDRYPGRCRRYTDRDGDGVCDYSQTSG